jgi:mannose-6-phosphate isomerase-like protein (cupin superfamily)
MRNVAINDVDHLPRRVLALGSDYPPNTLLRHSHRRAQFLYAMHGLMKVETDDGQWLVPPFSGVWIPATKPHRVWMPGVSTHSLYIDARDAPRESALRSLTGFSADPSAAAGRLSATAAV